jgi:hypothetical protein
MTRAWKLYNTHTLMIYAEWLVENILAGVLCLDPMCTNDGWRMKNLTGHGGPE